MRFFCLTSAAPAARGVLAAVLGLVVGTAACQDSGGSASTCPAGSACTDAKAETTSDVCDAGGCGGKPVRVGQSDPELVAYLRNTWGITIRGFDDWKQYKQDDGSTYAGGTATITVDGLGKQELRTETLIIPDEMGTTTSFFVAKKDGTEERYFLYDRQNKYVTIGDAVGERSVIVSANLDGTYDVDVSIGKKQESKGTGLSGRKALAIVEQYNEYASISPHILLMAFAAAHTPSTLEGRVPIHCSDTAPSPEVCTIFREFCDCIACSVLDKPGVCDPCRAP